MKLWYVILSAWYFHELGADQRCTADKCMSCGFPIPSPDLDCTIEEVASSQPVVSVYRLFCHVVDIADDICSLVNTSDIANCGPTDDMPSNFGCYCSLHVAGLNLSREENGSLTFVSGLASYHVQTYPASSCSDDEVEVTELCEVEENTTEPLVDFSQNRFSCRCYGTNCSRTITITITVQLPSQNPNSTGTFSQLWTVTDRSSDISLKASVSSSASGSPSNVLAGYLIALIVLSIVIVLLVLAAFAICFCCCLVFTHSRKRHHHGMQMEEMMDTGLVSNPVVLTQLIGSGKYGAVYKGVYEGEIVAVKIFSTHHRVSWENERSIYSLDSTFHKNILRFITMIEEVKPGFTQLMMVTEYCPLGSLSHFLLHNKLPWDKALNMMVSVTAGLAHLHSTTYQTSRGSAAEKYSVAHRDIKSANVLLTDVNGNCVLCDLGLALVLDPTVDDLQLANSGQVGTYRYMAPEALDARVNLCDIESFKQIDVYALALVIWEIMRRCQLCREESVEPYMPPFYDMVGERPTLDRMRDVVVNAKGRPHIDNLWRNDERGQVVAELLEESWDEDPEARLTAANILHRLELLQNVKSVRQSSPLALDREECEGLDDSTCGQNHRLHRKLCSSSSFSGRPMVRRTYHHPLRYSFGTEMIPPVSRLESLADHDCNQCQPVLPEPPNTSLVDSATGQPYTSFGTNCLMTSPSPSITRTSSSGSIEMKLEEVKPATTTEQASSSSQSSSCLT